MDEVARSPWPDVPGFAVRPVGAENTAGLLKLYHSCEDFLALGPVAEASEAMVLGDLALSRQQGGIFCGIYENASGSLAGVLDFVPAGWNGQPDQAYLSLLMLAPAYRDRGLGAAVVHALETMLCQSGRVRSFAAGVQVNNPRAVRFWQRMGFAMISGPLDLPDGTTCYDLLKPLADC